MLKLINSCSCGVSSTGLGREAEVAVSQARQSVLVHEPGISCSKPSSPPLASSGSWRGASCWSLPRLSSLSPCSCPLSSLPATHGHLAPAKAQTQRQLGRWVLTRATFIRALALAQTKQDTGPEAVGRMGHVWAEAMGSNVCERHLSAAFGSALCRAGKQLEPPQGKHA